MGEAALALEPVWVFESMIPVPPVALEEDVTYLATGLTDEDWKLGTD